MKKIIIGFIATVTIMVFVGCSSTKNTTGLSATRGNLKGTWVVKDIKVNVPAGYSISTVFDEAPYADFEGSVWNLIRNGKGSFTLTNGTSEAINWSIYKKSDVAELQFKKLEDHKARKVDAGYRLRINEINKDSFSAASVMDVGEGKTATVSYSFDRQSK